MRVLCAGFLASLIALGAGSAAVEARARCTLARPLPGDYRPQWAPDGTRLVLARVTSTYDRQIVVADVRSGRAKRIAYGEDPAWGRQGRVAYVRALWQPEAGPAACPPSQTDVFAVPVGGGAAVRLTSTEPSERAPAWSPDGRTLVVARSTPPGDTQPAAFVQGLVAIAPDNEERVLTAPADASDWDPAWSHDGRRIAFSRMGPTGPDGVFQADVFALELETGRETRLTHTPDRNEWRPTWSRDGALLAYSSEHRLSPWNAATGSVVVAAADGSSPRRRAAGVQPAWSPNGRRLAFSRRLRSGSWAIFVLDLRSGAVRRLTRR